MGTGFFPASFGRSDVSWTPLSPTSEGGKTIYVWHYASPDGNVYQDAAEITVADADGDPVGSTANQGNDNHSLIQNTAANKPTLKQITVDGKTFWVFRSDGNRLLQGALDSGLINPFTAFIVVKRDSVVNSEICDGDDDENRLYAGIGWAGGQYKLNCGSEIHGGTVDTEWHLWILVCNGASSAIYIDGGSAVVSGNAGTDNPDGLTLFGNYGTDNWDGDLATFLIYDALLSTPDINQVGRYIEDEYPISYTEIS